MPGHVVDWRVVDVPNDSERELLVRGVNDDLICCRNCKDHPVGQIEEWHLVGLGPWLLVQERIEFNAGGVCLQPWQHESRLAHVMLQETVDCVSVVALLGLVVRVQVVVACRWC